MYWFQLVEHNTDLAEELKYSGALFRIKRIDTFYQLREYASLSSKCERAITWPWHLLILVSGVSNFIPSNGSSRKIDSKIIALEVSNYRENWDVWPRKICETNLTKPAAPDTDPPNHCHRFKFFLGWNFLSAYTCSNSLGAHSVERNYCSFLFIRFCILCVCVVVISLEIKICARCKKGIAFDSSVVSWKVVGCIATMCKTRLNDGS